MFSCEYCEIVQNSFIYRTPLVAASEKKSGIVILIVIFKALEELILTIMRTEGVMLMEVPRKVLGLNFKLI